MLDTKVLSLFDGDGRNALSAPIVTVDSHTAGEPTRLVVDGLPQLPGETINDRRLYLMNEMDHVRRLLMHEPRGHRDMFGAVLTEPVTPEASFGLIYMDGRRYPYLCGHATIGAVTILIDAGIIEAQEPETVVHIDSPSGRITARAHVENERVQSVGFQAESSLVFASEQTLHVPEMGDLTVDVVLTGGFFVMVDAEDAGLDLSPENADTLIELGMHLTELANEQLTVQHPEREYINTVDVVEFYGSTDNGIADGKNAVIFSEAHMDRSPCGTGTCAKMALLHHRGELDVGERYVNQGVLGTTFEAHIRGERDVGGYRAIVPEVRGSAHITGVHRFVLDDDDPFQQGFLLGSQPSARQ